MSEVLSLSREERIAIFLRNNSRKREKEGRKLNDTQMQTHHQNKHIATKDEIDVEKQKTSRSAIPAGLCPNLFTLCTLQVFTVCNSATNFLRYQVTFAVLVPQNALTLTSYREYLIR